MRIDIRTAFIPLAPDGTVWLLKRDAKKKIFPNLITGIGGRIEPGEGETEDLERAGRREWNEEVPQLRDYLEEVRLRLVTHDTRGETTYVLLWFTVRITTQPTDTSCSEGVLLPFDASELPLEELTPTARLAIPFVLSLPAEDMRVYDGVFSPDLTKLTLSQDYTDDR